ncbi:hypothetical protein LTR91_022063 [Friedmanniomyces endolithicus]|uniref:Utp8 beta-propeller domain-containing protein n=1 Tax=Friedmanniomyces endolithicus TaxID=329885 RepID=A0AAN6JZ04_9PEZI|nr:hypothetical protein LTR57_023110 [Friedmanniomyces endolithicus]KAK0956537.1 hypothetical protein LTS01_022792 [Friedmanniomyces endolithicus]KAK0957044.1 hypothetical protein LTR91_022063 [Friedmanniomyces endolithicus]KAK1046092.1 hypothetical protein LTS16_006004 [Friedmanniomyces endolithicus]
MEAPYTIASLPKPLDVEHGTIQAAPVFGIRGSKKRKRHEIVVGIDGESVDIYNIQSQDRVTSYALPPQDFLCCPPCCVYVRGTKPGGAQRRTYLVLRSGASTKKRRLVCFTESVRKRGGLDDRSGPVKHEYQMTYGEIHAVEVIGNQSDQDYGALNVVATFGNGKVVCLSADLSQLLWQYEGKDRETVECTCLIDMETARRGLLAGREDIIAVLASGPGTSDQSQLLCQVMRVRDKRRLRLFSLRPNAVDVVQSQKPGMQHLVDLQFPSAVKPSTGRAKFDVHAASGKVYQLVDGRLTVFDFSGTLPRVLTTFGSKYEPITSFARVSASSVLAVLGNKAVVYETRYGAALGAISLSADRGRAIVGQKRLRDAEEPAPHLLWAAIAHFQDTGLITGLAGTELMAIQLSDETRHAKRSRKESTLLADVLGKGTSLDVAQASSNIAKNDRKLEKWDAWKTSIDSAIAEYDVSELERLLMRALIPQKKNVQQHQSNGEPAESEEEVERTDTDLDMSLFDASVVDRKKIMYLLSKVFTTQSEEDAARTGSGRLATAVHSELVYRLVAFANYLTLPHLRQATQATGHVARPGDLTTALFHFDGTFELMHDLLAAGTYWELPEIIEALRLLVVSLGERPAGTAAGKIILPAPASQANDDVEMVNGDADSQVESEYALAERELEMVSSTLEGGVRVRSEAFRMVLDRLTASPQDMVTKTMRAMMSHDNLFFFMKLLRLELQEGGWHQKYISPAVVDDDSNEAALAVARGLMLDDAAQKNQAIGHIGFLMSCAADAVGLRGWLVGSSADVVGTRDFMRDLEGEVSASMEGLYEHQQLAVFLEQVERLSGDRGAKSEMRGAGKAQRTGGIGEEGILPADDAIILLGGPVAEERSEKRVLPMGRRAEVLTNGGGKARGGEKSVRLVMAEKRARVGKYSLERIRI